MDVQQLVYFSKVADYQHITKAAKELYISQPALSSSIARMESELGTKLLLREGRNITLSPAGKIVYQHAKTICAEMAEMQDELAQLKSATSGAIHIGCSSQRSQARAIIDFLNAFPEYGNYRISQTSGKCEQLCQMLLAGDLDIAICSPPIVNEHIMTMPICYEEIFAVVPKSHRLANRESINIDELKSEKFVGLSKDYEFRVLCDEYCKHNGFTPNYVMELNFFTLESLRGQEATRAHAVLLTPESRADKEMLEKEGLVALKIADKPFIREISIAWAQANDQKHDIQVLIQFFANYYKDDFVL